VSSSDENARLLAEFEGAYREHDALMTRYIRAASPDSGGAQHAGLVLTHEMITKLTSSRERMNELHELWVEAVGAEASRSQSVP
jgi:hypothetical protein